MISPLARSVFVLLSMLVFAACSASSEVGREVPPEDPAPTYTLAEFEDFDLAPYPDTPPPREADIDHAVPARLLDGKMDTRNAGPRNVGGYRIQVYSSQNRNEADAKVEEIMRWWQNAHQSGELDDIYPHDASEPPVYLVFRQPYYRIRVGNFATRAEATQFQRYIERHFPGAFLLPDTVTLD